MEFHVNYIRNFIILFKDIFELKTNYGMILLKYIVII